MPKDDPRVTPYTAETLSRFEKSMIYPYLPPGTYEIGVPERTEKANGSRKGYTVKPASIKVTIDDTSPVFVVTKPLGIRFMIQDTASPGQSLGSAVSK